MSLISIIVPVFYNAPTLHSLSSCLKELAYSHPEHQFEFIYVDDGSGDDSYAVMKEIALKDQRVRLVRLVRNFGSNTAIMAGLSYAKGDCAGFIAADLQDPPEIFSQMICLWDQGVKICLATRDDRNGDPLLTRLFANVFNSLYSKYVFKGMSPQGIGFFLIDRKVIDIINQSEERNPYLMGLILWTGIPYKVVPYNRAERKIGKSRWTFSKKIKYFIDAFASFSYLPLRMASITGICLAMFGGLYAFILILGRIVGFIPEVQGWTALMVVLLLVSGVQLMMLGIIGEYLWRTLDATRKRPIFIVEEVIENLPE